MIMKLLNLVLSTTIVFASGGYDHGTSAGKGNLDLSFTLNPFQYFKQGQSYIILGYGLTNRIDLQAYYSKTINSSDNYYGGLLYQFYKSKRLDISTAIGIRKFIKNPKIHFFAPQLLYTIHLNNKLKIGGSIVNIKSKNINLGTASDTFIIYNMFNNKKYQLDFTIGVFNPALWQPKNNDWHPTYSIDIKIKG